MEFALSCKNVGKSFPVQREKRLWRILFGQEANNRGPVVEALKDISIDVPRGKIVGILGRNGAGKSTLLRLLGQVYTPTVGKVTVNGQVVGLFELGGFGNPNLTGREFALRYLKFMGVPTVQLKGLLEDIEEFSELGDAFDQVVRTYSSGMGARLYFSVATAYQYEIYLIDELLSVGDEHFQAKCWLRMRERLLSGASGVLVTHDWTAIVKLCENACIIEDGRFTFQGASDAAVVKYLKLPIHAPGLAKFPATLPREYSAETGKTAKFTVPIVIDEDVEVDCFLSIEMLRIGIGWEIVIISDAHTVAATAGNHSIEFTINDFPLVSGKYSLNLSLAKPPSELGGSRLILDSRSWTYGNGLILNVMGERTTATVKLPFEASKFEKSI